MLKINSISTEQVNDETSNIDVVSTIKQVELINNQDKKISKIIAKNINEIANLIDAAYGIAKKGGRIIYIGAGTSGRLGILDASEMLPTFGNDSIFKAIIAGGRDAIEYPVENAEDNVNLAIVDLKKININKKDMVIGMSASGRTPYVSSALEFCKKNKILTGSLSTSKSAVISSISDYPLEIVTGPETIVGSTRMKSGTAQKMVLNMISTIVMIKLGKVYHNLMIDVIATNKKLVERSIHMLMSIVDISYEESDKLLKLSKGSVKYAIIMKVKNISLAQAKIIFKNNNNKLKGIL